MSAPIHIARFVIDTQLDGWRKGAGSQHYVVRSRTPLPRRTPTRLPVRDGDLDRPLHPVRFVRPTGASAQDPTVSDRADDYRRIGYDPSIVPIQFHGFLRFGCGTAGADPDG
jgi:hypothetical protein